jgi:hypothetical protein
MIYWASAVSLHLPLDRVTLTIQVPKGACRSRRHPALLPKRFNFRHPLASASYRKVNIPSSLLGVLLILSGATPAGPCSFDDPGVPQELDTP